MRALAAAIAVAYINLSGPVQAADQKVVFLTPADGTLIKADRVVVIGRVPGSAEEADLVINGKKVAGAKRDADFFSVTFFPVPGRNTVEVKAQGGEVGKLTLNVGSGGGVPFTYHDPMLKEECNECHSAKTKGNTMVRASTCFQCHDGWSNKFVHGPVAGGECSFCHDPHGSVFPKLTRDEIRKLCQGCHNQPSSKEHLDKGQNKDCSGCHNPHGSGKQYLLRK